MVVKIKVFICALFFYFAVYGLGFQAEMRMHFLRICMLASSCVRKCLAYVRSLRYEYVGCYLETLV